MEKEDVEEVCRLDTKESEDGVKRDKDGAKEEEDKTVKEVEENGVSEAADTGKRFKAAEEEDKRFNAAVDPERGVNCMEEKGKAVKETLGGNIVNDGNPRDGVRVIEGVGSVEVVIEELGGVKGVIEAEDEIDDGNVVVVVVVDECAEILS